MKKILGILGIVAFSMALFFNTTSAKDIGDMTFSSLTTLNSANAEDCERLCHPTIGGACWDAWGACTSYYTQPYPPPN